MKLRKHASGSVALIAALVVVTVMLFATVPVAVALPDAYGGASFSTPYAPYTAGPVVKADEPYAPYDVGPHVPSELMVPYAPYTSGLDGYPGVNERIGNFLKW